MSETPRQNAQASRHARRQSPYTRAPAQESAAPSTPSRLRSLLSYVSPFRSGRKAKVEAAPTNESEERQVEQAATTSSAETESGDNGYSAKSESASSARATDEFDAPRAGPSTSTGVDAPTAFTPYFRPEPPALATFNNPPAFGTTSEAPSNTPVFRRKRPLYVGAGYTGRRKRVVKPAPAEIAAGPDAAVSGKRRRLVIADDDVSPPIRSTGGSGHTSELFGTVSPSRPLSRDAAANARSSATDPAQVVSAPKRTATRAADLVMDILRSEVPQEPALAKTSRREEDITRILNPYDTEENLLSTTVSSSRTALPPAILQKKKGGSVSTSSDRAASGAESLTETKEASPTKLLQRTMPAAYRRETLQHQRPQHSSPRAFQQSNPADAKQRSDIVTKTKRQVAVVEILSSEDDEEEEDDDDAKSASEGSREENEAETISMSTEESDRADESGEHVASDEELDKGGSDDAGVMVIDSADEEASSGSGAISPGHELDHSTVQARAPGAVAVAPVVPPTSVNPFARQVPGQASAPKSTSPIFSFGPKAGNGDTAGGLVESTLSAKPDTSAVRDDAAAATDRWRHAALDLPRASLPTQSFRFAQVMAEISHATVSVDPTLSGLAELAKNVSRGELPTFSF